MRQVGDKKADWCSFTNETKDGKEVAVIHIYDEIGYWGTDASSFVRRLAGVTQDSIELHINSPGGEIFDGVAIYNALKSHPADVHVIVDSLAASAASFIAQAGDTIQMTRNATMMIHDGSGIVYGNAKDMHDMGNLLDKLSDNIADIYSQRAGGSAEEWRALMREEVWYNADEAVEAKLADSVLDYSDDKAEEAKNHWNLALFNHAGRGEAPSPSEVRSKLASITNRAKEAPVTAKPTPPKAGPKATAPEGGAPAEEETELAPGAGAEEEAPEPEAEVTEEQPPAPTAKAKPVATNAAGQPIFMVAGKPVTDVAAVQRHIDVLETAADETKMAGRKTFIATLAANNKIFATQVDELEELAAELTDAQWTKWCAAYDKAPAQPLLENHGGTSSFGPQARTDNGGNADRISVLEEIINRHKMNGMPQAAIEKTPSWLELQQLKSNS
jgi:ATP-dependent Clp endopeptidase proteolytic subunit ClpP